MKRIICIFLLTILFTTPTFAYSKPESVSVNDYSGIISDSSKNYIKSKNDILFSHTKAKIIFITTPTTDGETIEDYCNNLYTQWDIKSLGRNNSVFFVIDTQKNQYDFIVGENISLALTDTFVFEVILSEFEPMFEKKEYDKAILNTYNALGKWYENHYKKLNLNLDENVDKYISGEYNADTEKPKNNLWIWLSVAGCIILAILAIKIKHRIEFTIRKHEREKLRKKYKIDIDKIVNS